MNRLYKLLRESDAAAWILTIAGIGLMVLIAFWG